MSTTKPTEVIVPVSPIPNTESDGSISSAEDSNISEDEPVPSFNDSDPWYHLQRKQWAKQKEEANRKRNQCCCCVSLTNLFSNEYFSSIPWPIRPLIRAFLLTFVCMFPSTLYYLIYRLMNPNTIFYELLLSTVPTNCLPCLEFLRWSIILTCTFLVFSFSMPAIETLPSLVLNVSHHLGVQIRKERTKMQLEAMTVMCGPRIRLWLTFATFWMALRILLYTPEEPYWPYAWTPRLTTADSIQPIVPVVVTFTNLLIRLAMIMWLAGTLLLIGRFMIYSTAQKFNERTFAERVDACDYAIHQVETLMRAARRASRRLREIRSNPLNEAAHLDHHKAHLHAKQRLSAWYRMNHQARTAIAAFYDYDKLFKPLKWNHKNNESSHSVVDDAFRTARYIFEPLTELWQLEHGEVHSLTLEMVAPFCDNLKKATRAMAFMERVDFQSNTTNYNAATKIDFHITRKALTHVLRDTFRERKHLARSLRDLDSILATLDRLATLIVVILVILLVLPLLGLDIYAALASMATLLLSASFIFGERLKVTFDCLVFLFVMHPFDVGDLVTIDGENLYVREMSVLTTTCRRTDGQIVLLPNASLLNTKIYNGRRCAAMTEYLEFLINVLTPLEQIDLLQERLSEFAKQYPNDYRTPVDVCGLDVKDGVQMSITVCLPYAHNFQDNGSRWMRRTKFLVECHRLLREIGIIYTLPVQRVLVKNTSDFSNVKDKDFSNVKDAVNFNKDLIDNSS